MFNEREKEREREEEERRDESLSLSIFGSFGFLTSSCSSLLERPGRASKGGPTWSRTAGACARKGGRGPS